KVGLLQSDSIDLELTLKAEKSSELTDLLNIKHPEVGAVSMTASLNGSTKQLKLQDIKLKAGTSGVLSMHADGWMAWKALESSSPQQLMDITLKAQAPSIQQAAHLYGEYSPDFGGAKFSIRIHGKGEVLKGSDLAMKIGTKNSLLIAVKGKVEKIFMTDLFYKGIDITGNLSAKSTSQLSKLLKNNQVPDIGPLSGKFIIKGDSDTLQVPHIALSAGRQKQLLLSAVGKITAVPLRDEALSQGVNINLAVTAPSSADLSVLAGSEIPDFGALSIKGVLVNRKDTLAIEKLVLTAGGPQQPNVRLSGAIEDVLSKKDIQMRVLFDEKTLVKLFDLHPTPDLGQLKGSILLSDAGGDFGVKDLKIESKNSELIDVKITSALGSSANKPDDISLNAYISIRHPALFGKLFATDLSWLGPVSSSGILRGNKDRITFKGNSIVGRTKVNSELVLSLINDKAEISGAINSPNVFLDDFGVPMEVSATKERPTNAEKDGAFNHTPFSLQALHAIDLNLQLRLFKITGMNYQLDRVNADLLLKNGQLTARPVKFNVSGGHVSMSVKVDAKEKPEWSLNMQADKVQLSKLLAQKHEASPLTG
ncbi:MAG: AsmA family protein, partial [Methyloprofundus sp.]|nr:AsmA family protein [Methyloprofundus sp.]